MASMSPSSFVSNQFMSETHQFSDMVAGDLEDLLDRNHIALQWHFSPWVLFNRIQVGLIWNVKDF